MNGSVWILAGLGVAHVAFPLLDRERQPFARIDTGSDGRVFVRYDFPGDEPADPNHCKITAFRAGVGATDEVLWRAEGWYAFTSWLSADGHHLARLGPWARGEGPEAEDLAIAFHEDGRLLKSYSTRDLVKNDSRVHPSASHYEWMQGEPICRDIWSDGTLELTTVDDITYTFNIRTGEIVDQVQRRPVAWSSDEPGRSDDIGEIADAVRDYYRDFSARDWPAFVEHFHEGAVLSTRWTPPGSANVVVMMSSVPEFVAKAPEGPGSQPIFEERPTKIDVRRLGDMAVAWVAYEVRFGAPDNLQEWTGTDAITLIQHEDRWRITSIAWSSD